MKRTNLKFNICRSPLCRNGVKCRLAPPQCTISPPCLTWACIPQIFHNLWDICLNQINYRKFMGFMPIQGKGGNECTECFNMVHRCTVTLGTPFALFRNASLFIFYSPSFLEPFLLSSSNRLPLFCSNRQSNKNLHLNIFTARRIFNKKPN